MITICAVLDEMRDADVVGNYHFSSTISMALISFFLGQKNKKYI